MKRGAAFLILHGALFAATPAMAQTPPDKRGGPPQGDSVTVGLGIGLTTSYDGGRDYRIIPGGALLGTVSGHDFRLNGPQLFVDAIRNNPARSLDVEFGPVAGVNFNRTGGVSDPRVEALGELDVAVELGLRASLGVRGVRNRTDKLSFAVTAVRDVASAHGSHVISPAIEYASLAGRRTFVRLAVTADLVGRKWARYNYGIDAAGAAASGLSPHDPGGGLASIGANLLATHSLSGQRKGWALFGVVSYKRLLGDVAASPIVRVTGSPNQVFASFGLGYTF